MRKILALAVLVIAGCSTHQHVILVTSKPSAQPVSAMAYDDRMRECKIITDRVSLTPCEFVFDGEATTATVEISFPGGDIQKKGMSFNHLPKTIEVYREPLIGLPLGSTLTERIEVQRLHFDARGK